MKPVNHTRIVTRLISGCLHHSLYKPQEDYEITARLLGALDEAGYEIVRVPKEKRMDCEPIYSALLETRSDFGRYMKWDSGYRIFDDTETPGSTLLKPFYRRWSAEFDEVCDSIDGIVWETSHKQHKDGSVDDFVAIKDGDAAAICDDLLALVGKSSDKRPIPGNT